MFIQLERLEMRNEIIEARIEDLQGQEQTELRERLRQDYCLADFLQCEIETGDIDLVLLEMKKAFLQYLLRQLDLLHDRKKTYKVCLDFMEDFDWMLTPEQYKEYNNKLIEKAIFHEWEITKE